jgi:mono/diheme cytochrome c family protein
MNALIRTTLLIALLTLAGCGGEKASDSAAASTPAAPAASSTGRGAVTLPPQLDAGPRAGASAADHEASERGEELFQKKGCSACHAFGVKKSGPDLAGVSMRRTALWMENQILHPDVMVKQDPIARELFAKHAMQMPNQGLTPEQAKDVIEFLKSKDAKGTSEEKEDSR